MSTRRHERCLSLLHVGGLSFALLLSIPADASDGLSNEERRTVLDLRVIGAVVETYLEHRGVPEPTRRFAPISVLRDDLDSFYSDLIPENDGWERDYLFLVMGDDVVVISRGPNGVIDDEEAIVRIVMADSGQHPSLRRLPGDDLILLSDFVAKRPRPVRDKQAMAIADIRSIATALEAYSIDNVSYPRAAAPVGPVTDLRRYLEPIYIRRIPTEDPWGNQFRFWSDGSRYALVSFGADGEPGHPYPESLDMWKNIEFKPEFAAPEHDIVFVDGQFVQWPHGFSQ